MVTCDSRHQLPVIDLYETDRSCEVLDGTRVCEKKWLVYHSIPMFNIHVRIKLLLNGYDLVIKWLLNVIKLLLNGY